MTENDLSNIKYDAIRNYMENQRENHISWADIRDMKFLDDLGLDFERWNNGQKKYTYGWPAITVSEWKQIAGALEEAEKEKIRIARRGERTMLSSVDELNDAQISKRKGSSWVRYKQTLKEKGFSDASIQRIQEQTLDILKNLSSDTTKTGPRKGLVVGNVQSGKTANMEALMAMAADNGWNYFVVLTGLTENLRKQTEDRLRKDLKKQDTNLLWDYVGYSKMGDGNFEYEDFSDPRRIMFSVVLKNKTRLEMLRNFLQKAARPEDIKLMIIDDEADQGSINTGDIEDEQKRKAINKLILDLVYGKNSDDKSKAKKFGALNYISYTATPYANCLNEFKDSDDVKTLYPESFISHISSGDGYFGPMNIFGLSDDEESDVKGIEETDRLDIVNFISKEQVKQTKELESGETMQLPEDMENAIIWFLCAVAVERFEKHVHPVSMLVHTNVKTDAHGAVYEAITSWLKANRNSLIDSCQKVYREQTQKFTLKDLETAYPDYPYLSSVKNYPDFDDLIPYIKELLSEITTIQLDNEQDKEFSFNKGVIVCRDNSRNRRGMDEEGNYVRLVYPTDKQLKEMGYAPAFLVIGGSTLSRGLTLEGLVSSYFLRNSIQADSLMQMGRWFGYRRGYELLPRIWMTEDTFKKFQYLVDIEEDLRSQIRQLSEMGKKPTDFQLSLITYPKANWLRLTSKNKMQRASRVTLDYTGSDMQLTTYLTDRVMVKKNNEIIQSFIDSLGSPEISELDGFSCIWRDIPFSRIEDEIFNRGFKVADTSRTFQNIPSFRKWIDEVTKKGGFEKWTVILAGTQISEDHPEKNLVLKCGRSVGKVNRAGSSRMNGKLSIKVLTNKRDYVTHLKASDFPSKDSGKWDPHYNWDNIRSEKKMSTSYAGYLKAANMMNIPLLIFYCVDKHSTSLRKGDNPEAGKTLEDLGMHEDFFGMAMVVPGVRGKHPVRMQIDKNFYEKSEEEEDGD